MSISGSFFLFPVILLICACPVECIHIYYSTGVQNLFDEALEKKWVEQWLFYANATRMASAMAGTDYGVFVNVSWYLSRNIQEMIDWLHLKLDEKKERKDWEGG